MNRRFGYLVTSNPPAREPADDQSVGRFGQTESVAVLLRGQPRLVARRARVLLVTQERLEPFFVPQPQADGEVRSGVVG